MSAVTASMLYDFVECPQRVSLDLFGDQARRDNPSPFVQLLWERGTLYEQRVVGELKDPFTNLKDVASDQKEKLTLEAIARKDPLIYGGRISHGDLVGEPDLLRLDGDAYVAGDIKSGSGEEGGSDDEDGKLKVRYAVQLGLYTDILEQIGKSAGRKPFVWDIHGKEVTYDLTVAQGKKDPRALWEDYQDVVGEVRAIVAKKVTTAPAYGGVCKNCVWYTYCGADLATSDDLTLIPYLGRSKRDVLVEKIPTRGALAAANLSDFVDEKKKKSVFAGIGAGTLETFIARAKLLTTKGAKPFLRGAVLLPSADKELFFDIEVDPLRDVCYLHGFIERAGRDNATEKFVSFFAEKATEADEKKAFGDAWAYIAGSGSAATYYYGSYERTWYRKLRKKYPDVCTEEELNAFFELPETVNLYNDIVVKATEWPTIDHSIKTLAKYLGFGWRDLHPSGAASIEWFDKWVKTADPAVRQRILEYNEDDCRATRVVVDEIRSMASG